MKRAISFTGCILSVLAVLLYVNAAIAQTLLPFSSGPAAGGGGSSFVLPADSQTTYQPGVTFNQIPAAGAAGNTIPSNYQGAGYGFPTRTQCGSTLHPLGGGMSDTASITNAWNACPSNTFLWLSCGRFNITTPINFNGNNYTTLRGCGPGTGAETGLSPVNGPGVFVTDATATQLDYTNATVGFGPVVGIGGSPLSPSSSSMLASDTVFGSYTAVLNSVTGLNVGDVIRIDQNTDQDPDVNWGPNHCFQGAQVLGNASGTTLNVTSVISGFVNPITLPITSGSYVSGTGVVTITGLFSDAFLQFNQVTLASLTGTGAFASLNGTWQVITSSGNTITAQATSGLGAATVTGGHINGQDVFVTTVGIGGAKLLSQTSGTTGGVGAYLMDSSQTIASGSYITTGCATRAFFISQDRSLGQLFEIAAINSGTKTLTFTTPARYTYCAGTGACSNRSGVVAGTAMAVWGQFNTRGVAVEELQIAFGIQGGNGNLIFSACSYCWAKHVDLYWSLGANVLFSGCFRCELRDSAIHETPSPSSGGGGYMIDIQSATSEMLTENNWSWSGDKNMVGQATGGGNVFAYNYTADAFQSGFPSLPESGLNEAHMTTSKFALYEGNESHEISGDSYWGPSNYLLFFRNNITDQRPAWPPLNSWVSGGGCPYVDDGQRAAVQVGAHTLRNNFVGNIIGFSGQMLFNKTSGACQFTQGQFAYEELTSLSNGQTVFDWYVGELQSNNNTWDSTTINTQLRQGNWSWFLGSQIWYLNPIGATGSTSTGPTLTLPTSYYYVRGETQPPWYATSAFCPCTWPFVNPSSGTTNTMPAKARFLSGQMGGNYMQL